MTVIRSRSRQLSLSIAGILALILLLGLVFVPQELGADAASRFADLAQYFDKTLSGAWHSAFMSRGSAHSASVSASQSGGGSHTGAPAILTGGETRLSAAANDSLINIMASR